jgi:hypothetical protein
LGEYWSKSAPGTGNQVENPFQLLPKDRRAIMAQA